MIAGGSSFADTLIAVHAVAALSGVCLALYADATGLRVLFSRGRSPGARAIARLHGLLTLALCVVLATGVSVLSLWLEALCVPGDGPMILRIDPRRLPDKTAAKIALTGVLVGCAVLIDRKIVPLAARTERPLLAALSLREVVWISMVGTASLVSWVSIAAIAIVRELHTWPAASLIGAAAIAWIACSVALLLVLSVGRLMLRWNRPVSRMVRQKRDGGFNGFEPVAASRHVSAGAPGIMDRMRNWPPRDGPAGLAMRFAPGTAHDRARGPHRANTEDCARCASPVTLGAVYEACRKPLFGAAAISLMTNMLMLAGPIYMLQVYDRVLTSRSVETLVVLTILIAGLYAAMGVLELIRARVLARIAIRFDRKLAPLLIQRATEVRTRQDDIQNNQPLRDLELIRNFIAGPAPAAILDLPWAPLYFGVVFLMHPLLGLLASSGACILVGLSVANEYMTREPLARAARDAAAGHALVDAGARNAEVLKAMGMGEAHRRRWQDEHVRAMSAQLGASDIASSMTVSIRIVRLLLQSLLLGVGAWLALQDAVSPGIMIAASIISTRALAPIEQVVSQWRSVLSARAALKRCKHAIGQGEQSTEHLVLPPPCGEIVVSNLFVAPPGSREPVLKGLKFHLQPGDGLAVLGPSAAGKSTLARALVGIWPLRHGEIRLDGARLDQWDPRQLGPNVGYLPQDAMLLEGTIAQNIARFEPSPDPQSVLAAAAEAGVHDLILQLPQGYQTRVGDGGASLSGGQRQRIALARALYGNPAFLVLDEPNSNLDHDGEQALVAAIARARQAGQTVVVMAHRQSVLAAVNLVLVLKDGRQVAFGAPQDVLRAKRAVTEKEKPDGNRPVIANSTARA